MFCRRRQKEHKLRNVLERLPKEQRAQTKSVMNAAFKLEAKAGMEKLRQQAKWLQAEHADAAASLLEGIEEMFTVNRLGLPPTLMRCLTTTNIIENPNGIVRNTTHRVKRWRDQDMALRWTAAGFLEAEKTFRKVLGFQGAVDPARCARSRSCRCFTDTEEGRVRWLTPPPRVPTIGGTSPG